MSLIGAHVTYTALGAGRTLLGEVTDVYFDHASGAFRLKVRFFNGEPWPWDPLECLVEVLEHTYEQVDGIDPAAKVKPQTIPAETVATANKGVRS